MKVGILSLFLVTVPSAAMAQDIYTIEALSGSDLNGTARFVGMGGAMSALGGDLSVINTNPAGIGLYRKSDVALSFSTTTQADAQEFHDVKKTRLSFDQGGGVYAQKVNSDYLRYFNFAFNYHKTRNLKNVLFGTGALNGISQSDEIADLANAYGTAYDIAEAPPLAYVAYNAYMINEGTDGYTGRGADAQSYSLKRAAWGGVQAYDFNLSANINDRVYVGLTMGVYNVNYHSYALYGETLANDYANENYEFETSEYMTGTGFDAKFGVIFRPLANSPLRIGLAFSTPVYYNLDYKKGCYAGNDYTGIAEDGTLETSYDDGTDNYSGYYDQRSPWKFNFSIGTTIGTRVALGAEYEVSDYSSANVSVPDYDGYLVTDVNLKDEINRFLNVVHTFRLGLEVRALDNTYLRLGYNHVTAPYNEEAFLNLLPNDYFNYTDNRTDYVNIGATNRVTAGIGWHGKQCYLDLAYQYQNQSATIYAFHYNLDSVQGISNELQGIERQLKHHNVVLTLGYRF